jgi:tetratricopeptide (TPR) repeat protein
MLIGLGCLFFAATILLRSAPLPDEQLPELRIEISSIGDAVSPKYLASLERIQDRQKIGSAESAPDGIVRFRDVPYGEYRLTIISRDGAVVCEQRIAVNSMTSTLVLNLPAKMTLRTVSGTVSVSQLRHPIPKRALMSFKASQKLFDKGDYEGAAHELERALTISPDYAEAYSTLAAAHIRMGLYEQSLKEIAKAMSIVGPNARDLASLALADYKLERYADSVEAASWALRLDPNYDPAHFVLGATLAMDRRTMQDSVPHLAKAARTIDSAKAILVIVQKTLSRD